MEKKCPHHPKSVLCRQRRKDAVGESSGRVGRLPHHTGKVGQMKIVVIPTTGGQLEVCVSPAETVRGLKQVLARKYRIAPARINLLHKDRVLKDGSLRDNQVTDGSRVVLCPNMESGTSPSRAEHSVIQALKNLSQSQIHDFLSGRAPLTLAIRLGEHLMFVQLQLSTSPTRALSVQPTPPSTPTALSPPPHPPSPTPPAATPAPTATAAAAATASSSHGARGGGRQGSGNVGPVLVPPPVPAVPPAVDPVTLLQASHNLTEKLKELTQLTEQAVSLQAGAQRTQAVPSMPLTPPPSPPPSPGAVIDSMHHMGRGVYSGTFSGTLDPRLQDRSGQPRRDVNTILHILHDLLLARPSSQLTPTPTSPSSSPSSPLQHPPQQAPPSSPRSPATCVVGGGGGGEEVVALRDKVQRVQQMLEQRRQRRLTRRLTQRPYPSSSAAALMTRRCHPALSESTSFPFPPTSSSPNTTTAATTAAAASTAAGGKHGESVDTANYRKPNMEQETVAV